jgi:phosphoribosylformylglycinamidine synthase subunit PurS
MSARSVTALAWSFPLPILSIPVTLSRPSLAKPVPKLMAESLKIRILVRPKAGILDPQGEAVRSALPALGFGGVGTVHVGRLIEMEVESTDEVDRMCRRLLANPTIEEYEWEVVG